MPKAANVNWYQMAREAHRQKRANALTLARAGTAMIPYSRTGAYLSQLRSLLSSAAPYVNPMSGKALPFYSGMMLGDLSGSTGGFGTRGAISSLFKGKDPSVLDSLKAYAPYAAAGLGTAGVLGGAAYMGSRAGKNEAKKKKKPEGEKQSNLGGAGLGAAGGAALGGLGGGLYGALAPGYERDPETGRRKRRSRLMAALRGLAGGAAVGGAAGGAAGYLAGDNNIKSVLEKFLAAKGQDTPAAAPTAGGISTDKTLQTQPDAVEVAKAEASQPAPSAIPQGPTNFNSTMGGSVQPGPGLQNSMPPDMNAIQNVMNPPNPMPSASPAAGMGQGPANFNSTMGSSLPQQQPTM